MTTEALEALAADGDPIIQGELARRRAAAAAIAPPATTAELLGRLPEDPTYPPKAAQLLAVEFDDERSRGPFFGLCQRAYQGRLDPRALAYAYGKAMGPGARNRGAIFTHELKRWRPGMR